MREKLQSKLIEDFERQLLLQAKDMPNSELRDALLEVRKSNRKDKNESGNELDVDSQKNLLMEGVYSQELKRRELLEWALKTKTGRK